uniref:Photosynthesis system II assembly factor Ycf48/Hcf136-like domain-containing protein n=1 Tax=Zea mays TaxID=4577 RepID=A0A804PCY7_MAIZE
MDGGSWWYGNVRTPNPVMSQAASISASPGLTISANHALESESDSDSESLYEEEAWDACGSNVLHKTTNKGKSWVHNKAVAANLYSVKFLDDNKGFVLGNDDVLLQGLG